MGNLSLQGPAEPLKVDEIIQILKNKWGVSYEMRILIRDKTFFLHIMWGFLEQKSFPENEEGYKSSLSNVLDIINRSGQSSIVRNWLLMVKGRPKPGKALSLRLKSDYRLEEFVL